VRHDLEYLSIPNAVRGAARKWGDAEAVVDGEIRWTFAELERQMLRSVRAAMAVGIEPGDRVAVLAPNAATWIVAALGIQGAGGILVPVNTRFKAEEIAHVLDKSGAKMLITVGEFLGNDYLAMLDEGAPDALDDVAVVLLDDCERPGAKAWSRYLADGEAVPEELAHGAIDEVGGSDLSDIMFTSGTTGAPKGVMLDHGQSLRTYGWLNETLTLRPGDRSLVVPPFFHAFGYKAGWMANILDGVTTVPLAVFDVIDVMSAIERERITVMYGPPTLFGDLLAHPRRGEFDLSSLRIAMPGSAGTPAELYGRIRDELGLEAVISGYGLTEATAVVSAARPTDDFDQIATSAGRPMADTEVIAAADDGSPLAAGESGEILVRGYNVMRGYWDDPAATAETIDAEGWLHTGDIGELDEGGFIRITDRKKDMVIVGGFNVYPAEVERILAEHEAVAQAAVVGIDDARFGEVTAAFVVPTSGAAPSPEEIGSWARGAMANFKVPRLVVVVDELPRNASQKVLKPVLRERAQRSLTDAC
jgi:acyl-CoA synthetase (AMP-forming)/AMP-acid ligase II